MTLPSFDDVNARLHALVEAQDDPSGCQVIYMPMDAGCSYILQVAFRDKVHKPEKAAAFLMSAYDIIKAGNRRIVYRTPNELNLDRDFANDDLITKGYARLWAFEDEGDTSRLPDEDETVALSADL